jgi:hypothetical protein
LARTRELDQHREVVSGGDKSFQLAGEVKACTLEEREKILEDLQSGIKVVIPTSHALAMKADLGIPWSKLRAIRRSDNGLWWKRVYHNTTVLPQASTQYCTVFYTDLQ